MTDKYAYKGTIPLNIHGVDVEVTVATRYIKSRKVYKTEISGSPLKIKGGPWESEDGLSIQNTVMTAVQDPNAKFNVTFVTFSLELQST